MPVIDKKKLRHNQKVYEGVCPICGVKFYANRRSAVYCSALCRTNAYLDRKRVKKENIDQKISGKDIVGFLSSMLNENDINKLINRVKNKQGETFIYPDKKITVEHIYRNGFNVKISYIGQ